MINCLLCAYWMLAKVNGTVSFALGETKKKKETMSVISRIFVCVSNQAGNPKTNATEIMTFII